MSLFKTPLDSLIVTNVPEIKNRSAENMKLGQNHPNPFVSNTKIDFELYNGGNTRLIIMNNEGKIVKSFEYGNIDLLKQTVNQIQEFYFNKRFL